MPDQAAALAVVTSPATTPNGPGSANDADAGGRVIPLDTRRRRPSAASTAASRAIHPAQMWAERRRHMSRAVVEPSA
jgi:hypothetical protein